MNWRERNKTLCIHRYDNIPREPKRINHKVIQTVREFSKTGCKTYKNQKPPHVYKQ